MFTKNPLAATGLACFALIRVASAQTYFSIDNAHSHLVLDVRGYTLQSGTPIQQFTLNLGLNQKWLLYRPTGSFTYQFASADGNFAIDIQDASPKSGKQLQQQIFSSAAPTQQWQIERSSGAGYTIVNPTTGLVFDVPHSSTNSGTIIQLFTANGGLNQQWNFMNLTPQEISLSATATGIVVEGIGFAPATRVCLLLESPAAGEPACLMTGNYGSFQYEITAPGGSGSFDSSLNGYTVVTVEDSTQALLAIGSIEGLFVAGPTKSSR